MSTGKRYRGIKIRDLPRTSGFYKAGPRTGLRPGDRIVAVNGGVISDELEFRYLAASPQVRLDVVRNNRTRTMTLQRRPGTFLNIDFHQAPVRRCANRCIFCFIDQMPPGLRKALYIKDEDLTHSFLNGNYVTLSNAGRDVLQRIVRLGLSPLFVSVHATDPLVRRRMLGIKRAPPIMEQLSFLTRNNIKLHTQIVVCPGYNDGTRLASTVHDLFSLGDNLLSIAVVPVGLTKFRRVPLAPVDASMARKLCHDIGALSDRDEAQSGRRRLFLADEIFLRAGAAIPPASYYGEYPQIENGVGLVRQLLENWKNAKRRPHRNRSRGKKYLLLTSVSAFPFLYSVAHEVEELRSGTVMHAEAVTNVFFGTTVTVAGLLTARDVLAAARRALRSARFDRLLLPAAMFNYAGYTLDGWSAKRLAEKAGIPVRVVGSVEKILKIN
jgi:putative radical SAM enzyme (TIGR03279 family)